MSSYCIRKGEHRLVVDTTGQRLRAEVDPEGGADGPALFDEDIDEDFDSEGAWPAPLHSSVTAAGLTSSFVPLVALAAKAKAFDDRLMAALEGVLHDGAGEFEGLYSWLPRLRGAVEAGTVGRGLLDAAAHLCGEPVPTPTKQRLQCRRWLAKFKKDPSASRPLGIYTQTEALADAFRHDRLLQAQLDLDDAEPLRLALESHPDLLLRYRAHLALIARITNPLAHPSVLDACAENVRFLPPSDALENRLVLELFGNAPVPDGFELVPELVAQLRAGGVSSVPEDDDGWYAHQFHANAALLEPSAAGLEYGPAYCRELEETFGALFTLTRETHVKQLDIPVGGAAASPEFLVAPRVSVEPVPTYYERVAAAYGFLSEQLVEHLGPAVIDTVPVAFGGPSIRNALLYMELLFAGAAAASRRELAQPAAFESRHDAAVAVFRSWQADSVRDPDLSVDLRVAVPVYLDRQRQTVRLCVTLGVETRSLDIEFVEPPRYAVHGPSSDDTNVETVGRRVTILAPITIECDAYEPPSRAEVRALCELHKTPAAIADALDGWRRAS